LDCLQKYGSILGKPRADDGEPKRQLERKEKAGQCTAGATDRVGKIKLAQHMPCLKFAPEVSNWQQPCVHKENQERKDEIVVCLPCDDVIPGPSKQVR